jgi:RNA polymerase sigma factor (TIGR02999 family)
MNARIDEKLRQKFSMSPPLLTGADRNSPGGSQPAAWKQLPQSTYDELRRMAERMMRREASGHSLQPTALLHEAFLRMAGQQALPTSSKTHVRALFAVAMQRILVDHARRRMTRKRGGQRVRIALDEKLLTADAEQDLLDLQGVLEKLAKVDAPQARLVELRVFGGLTVEEAAQELGISKRTAEREWTAARAWLRRELAALAPHDS